MSHYFVLWSGGLDSTYLIEYLLKEGHKVTAAYIEILNNTNKTARELAAIEKMHPYFTSTFGDSKFSYRGNVMSMDIKYYTSNVVLPQIFAWTSVWYVVPAECDYIAIGYVMGDCAISFLDEIKASFNGNAGLLHKHIPVTFPLTKHDKLDIWSRVHLTLREHVTWCEDEMIDKCGKCSSCKRMLNDDLMTIPKLDERELPYLKSMKLDIHINKEPVVDANTTEELRKLA